MSRTHQVPSSMKLAFKFFAPTILACLLVTMLVGPTYSSELHTGVKLHNEKRYKDALVDLEAYLKKYPRSANACYYAALCYQHLGQTNKAISKYRLVVSYAPKSKIGKYSISILKKLDPKFIDPNQKSIKTNKKDSKSDKPKKRKRDTSGDNIPNVARVHLIRTRALTLPVKLNGKEVWTILDTGAPTTIMYKSALFKIGKGNPQRPYDGYTGGVDLVRKIGYWIIPVTLQVGPIIKQDFDVRFVDSHRGQNLLGQDFYKEFDYTKDNNSILFTKKGYYKNVVSVDNSVPFKFVERGNRIVVKLRIKDKLLPVILDTGNTAAGIHFHSAHQARKYGLPVPAKAKESRVIGATGSSGVYRYWGIGPFKLGPVSSRGLMVTVNSKGDIVRLQSEAARLERKPKKDDFKFDDFLPLLGQSFIGEKRYTIDMDKKLIHFSR